MMLRLSGVVLGAVFISAGALQASPQLDEWVEAGRVIRQPFSRNIVQPDSSVEIAASDFAEENAIASRQLAGIYDGRLDWTSVGLTGGKSILSECSFVTADGVTGRFAVYGVPGRLRPYYLALSGLPAVRSADYAKTAETVTGRLCGRCGGLLSGIERVLDAEATEIQVRGGAGAIPFARFRFFAIDDLPGANWGHPCRLVFVSEDLSEIAVSYRMFFPQVKTKDGGRIPYVQSEKPIPGVSMETAVSQVYGAAKQMAEESAANISYHGDTSHSHFLLISGGDYPENNGIRFWSDTAMLYSTLTKKYKVPKTNIKVYMSDGTSSAKDANLYKENSPVLVSSPLDLDGDGAADITGPAKYSVVRSAIASLASTLTADDQLFVFVTSHGEEAWSSLGSDVKSVMLLYLDHFGDFDDEGNPVWITDVELGSWTRGIKCPVSFVLETCYSGGFIDRLVASGKRVVFTAATGYENSYGSSGPGYWGNGSGGADQIGRISARNAMAFRFTSAMRGFFPANVWDNTAFPWNDGAAVSPDPDTDKDGMVSMYEAMMYAKNNDHKKCDIAGCEGDCQSWRLPLLRQLYADLEDPSKQSQQSEISSQIEQNKVEHPQFAESVTGLAKTLFMVKKSQEPVGTYIIRFDPDLPAYTDANGGYTGTMEDITVKIGEVVQLPPCNYLSLPPSIAQMPGMNFPACRYGWYCEKNGKRYDNRALVFNLAEQPGEIVVLKPVWNPDGD